MKIVINRSDAIGDTILTMPMAKFIKNNIPDAEIVFIISPRCLDLFENHPYVDKVWVIDPKKSSRKTFLELRKKFKEFSPQAYFYVGGSHIPSYVSFIRRVPIRGGLKSKWQSFLFLNKATRQHRSFVAMHEACYNMCLLEPLGLKYNYQNRDQYSPEISIRLEVKEDSLNSFVKLANEDGKKVTDKLCFIHPGMTGHTLNWSARNYARLILKMEKSFPEEYTFVISHTPSDQRFLSPVKEFLNSNASKELAKRIVFFDGSKKGLKHYMGVLSHANIFVGPSTGTTHIANTLGVKVVGIYSPIKVQSSSRWGPFNRDIKSTKVIVPDVVCGELKQCSGQICPYYQCMDKVEVDDVLESVQQLVAEIK